MSSLRSIVRSQCSMDGSGTGWTAGSTEGLPEAETGLAERCWRGGRGRRQCREGAGLASVPARAAHPAGRAAWWPRTTNAGHQGGIEADDDSGVPAAAGPFCRARPPSRHPARYRALPALGFTASSARPRRLGLSIVRIGRAAHWHGGRRTCRTTAGDRTQGALRWYR